MSGGAVVWLFGGGFTVGFCSGAAWAARLAVREIRRQRADTGGES